MDSEKYVTLCRGINSGFEIIIREEGADLMDYEVVARRNHKSDAIQAAKFIADNRGLKLVIR